MNVLDLARPEVRALTPYSSARMEAQGAAIMLNANESPWPPVGDDGQGLNRYPDPQPAALRERMAAVYGVRPEQMLIGRGSDEAIDLLVRAFCRPGVDAIAVSPPTFGMYAVCAGVQGAAVETLPLDADFGLDVDAVLAGLSPAVKLLFVCSPNNPTGGLVPQADIARLASALDGRALVIVDEAYIEFAEAESAATLLGQHANLGVLRTLSKAWALAGARIGALLADADVIALLRRIMPPYPLPTPCVQAALAALDETAQRQTGERVATIVAERERLAAILPTVPGVRAVYPSRANFLTVSLDDAPGVYRALLAQGIVVRDVGRYPGLAGCLRFSIGTPEENARLLDVLHRCAEAA
ncbi:histidinol-phosphate transaminase [Oleiagrimonas soli]|uniref:Histidinol-phosphate aminotransferase n=1 Tax=Oleiagrimonas soli TaxID=1543381 RepID=A0A099CY42_9GAMM|nr:histidinol-phosphate transaminase [Oleiagrimonas soli]KGI77955.1 histidinol-phosphate aminotransferase [Oleiagrimonas soli]MBB6183670.1 histidinol-phosphate aminotransferase [Oleiagrimonas soli]